MQTLVFIAVLHHGGDVSPFFGILMIEFQKHDVFFLGPGLDLPFFGVETLLFDFHIDFDPIIPLNGDSILSQAYFFHYIYRRSKKYLIIQKQVPTHPLQFFQNHLSKHFQQKSRTNNQQLDLQAIVNPSQYIVSSQLNMSSQAKPLNSKEKKEDKATEDTHYIGDIHTAPTFMKDNDHITHGYRINFNTPRKIFRSLFMVHNQSVNIWSHCIPALFIIFFLATFYVMVDSEAVRKSFQQYHQDLQKGVDHYMNALDNLSLITEYDKFSKKTQSQISQLKQTVMLNYQEFIKKFQESSHKLQNTFESEVDHVKTNFKEILKQNMANFERAKREFQLKLAPLLIEEVSQKLDTTWLHNLKEKVQELKKAIDSDNFQIIQLHQHQPNPQQISRWPIVVFLSTAIFCLVCSSIFHLFYPMSSKIYTITNRFDYAGVNILISGSAFPPYYYGMYCQPEVAIIYLTCVISFAVFCFVVCLFEWIHRHQNKKYKGFLYGTFGCSLAIPLVHMLINEFVYDNYGDPFSFFSSIPYYLLLGASYLTGLYIYVQQCPQRNNPGRYNTCGHSHQIWHGFVVLGIFFTYLGALQNFQMRKISVCPA